MRTHDSRVPLPPSSKDELWYFNKQDLVTTDLDGE